jgi:hypothetical protein
MQITYCNAYLMNNSTSYDKIKHLVEIEDDIFAVFTISRRTSNDLTIVKNIKVEKNIIKIYLLILTRYLNNMIKLVFFPMVVARY